MVHANLFASMCHAMEQTLALMQTHSSFTFLRVFRIYALRTLITFPIFRSIFFFIASAALSLSFSLAPVSLVLGWWIFVWASECVYVSSLVFPIHPNLSLSTSPCHCSLLRSFCLNSAPFFWTRWDMNYNNNINIRKWLWRRQRNQQQQEIKITDGSSTSFGECVSMCVCVCAYISRCYTHWNCVSCDTRRNFIYSPKIQEFSVY